MTASTTSLAVVAHALDVPLEALSQWQVFRPEAFHPGPDGYDVGAIAQAGRDWMRRRPYEADDLVNRLERAAALVDRQGDLFGDIAAHFRRITPAVEELTTGEQTPKSASTLRAIVESALARARAAGLDLDNVDVPVVPTSTRPPAVDDAEL